MSGLPVVQQLRRHAWLRWYAAALAFTNVCSAAYWGENQRLVHAVTGPDPLLCWPMFQTCQWLAVFSSAPQVVGALWSYGAFGVLATVLLVRRETVHHGVHAWLLCLAIKAVLQLQSYLLMGNYHYMPWVLSVALLLVPARRHVLSMLVVLFYVAAGLLKFDVEWLSGAALLRPGPLTGNALYAAQAWAVVFEMVVVWGLLSRRWVWRAVAVAHVVFFHAVSAQQVGWFYPVVMTCVVSIFPLRWWAERKATIPTPRLLLRGRLPSTANAALALFVAAQVWPWVISPDPAITGEGRLLSLNMMDAHARCEGALFVTTPDRQSLHVPIKVRSGVRIACDPASFLAVVRDTCARLLTTHSNAHVQAHLASRRATDSSYTPLVSQDGCASLPTFNPLWRNPWLHPEP